MKVLVISYMYPNARNPNLGIFIEERLINLSRVCDVKLINPYPWIPPFGLLKRWTMPYFQKQNNIEIYRPKYFPLPGSFFNFIKGIWCFIFIKREIKGINRKFNFDIIHAHRVFPEGFAAVLLARIYKKPAIVTIHGSDINFAAKNPIIKKMVTFTLKKASKIIVVSKTLKKLILELRAPEEKIEVLLNAVDTNKFKPQNKEDARNKLSLDLNKKIILFVGNLVDVKNPLFLIEACHRLKERGVDNFVLVMIGDGYLKNKIKNKITEYCLEKLIFLIGLQSHEKIPLWMSAADFLVLPSKNEGMPTVVLEAMACALPVIATEVGGIPEIIKDYNNGILIPSDDIEKLEKGMSRLINDEKLREEISRKGLFFIKEKGLTWLDEAYKTFGIYKGLL